MNKYDKIFDWYTIDEAFEICKGEVMKQIERKLDHQEKVFMANVFAPYDVKTTVNYLIEKATGKISIGRYQALLDIEKITNQFYLEKRSLVPKY